MTELLSLRAGGRRADVPLTPGEATRIRSRDWPSAEQRPFSAEGSAGSRRVGPSEWGDATTTYDVGCDEGHVQGDGAIATNRALGRAPIVAKNTSAGAAEVSIAWTVDTAGAPATLDFGAAILASHAATVVLEVVRGGSALPGTLSRALQGGRWTRLDLPAHSTGGAGTLLLRARATLPPGGTLSGRLPVVGVGLDGQYFDQNTPGATGKETAGVVTRAERAASGSDWVDDWLADLRAIEAAAARDIDATMVVERDGRDTLTWPLHSIRIDPSASTGVDGFDQAKLVVLHGPHGFAATRTLPGTLTAVGQTKTWTADEPVLGDVPAEATVDVSWAEARRDAVIDIVDLNPFDVQPTIAEGAWTYEDAPGRIGTNVVRGRLPRPGGKPVIAARYVSPIDGVVSIEQRLAVHARSSSTDVVIATLLIGDRVAASAPVAPTGHQYANSAAWRRARFGRHRVRSGQLIRLQLSGALDGPIATVDVLSFLISPSSTASFEVAGLPPGVASVGDDFSVSNPDTGVNGGYLNGPTTTRFPSIGGSWDAPDWTWSPSAAGAKVEASGSRRAQMTSTWTLGGSVGQVTLDTTVALTVNPNPAPDPPQRVGLFVNDSKYIVLQADDSDELQVRIKPGVGAPEIRRPLPKPYTGPLPVWIDARLQLDRDGRLTVWLALTGRRLQIALQCRLETFVTGSDTFSAAMDSRATAAPCLRLLRFTYGEALPYGAAIRWGRGDDARPPIGDYPTLNPGARPKIVARAAETAIDSATSASKRDPTSVAVSYTPAYLQLP